MSRSSAQIPGRICAKTVHGSCSALQFSEGEPTEVVRPFPSPSRSGEAGCTRQFGDRQAIDIFFFEGDSRSNFDAEGQLCGAPGQPGVGPADSRMTISLSLRSLRRRCLVSFRAWPSAEPASSPACVLSCRQRRGVLLLPRARPSRAPARESPRPWA